MTTKRPSHLEDQARDAMESTAERSEEAFKTMTVATTEASEAMQNSFATAVKGIRNYNAKIAEFAAANIQSQTEFVQRLGAVRSPTEFAEICQSHSSQQLKTLTEQARQLVALAQEIAGSSSEPLKKGFDKASQASRYQG